MLCLAPSLFSDRLQGFSAIQPFICRTKLVVVTLQDRRFYLLRSSDLLDSRNERCSWIIHSVAAIVGSVCMCAGAGSSCYVWHSVENDFPLKVLNVRIWCVILNFFQVNETEMFSCFHPQKFYPSVQKRVRARVRMSTDTDTDTHTHTHTHTLRVSFFLLSLQICDYPICCPPAAPSCVSFSQSLSHIIKRRIRPMSFFSLTQTSVFLYNAKKKKKKKTWSKNRCRGLF